MESLSSSLLCFGSMYFDSFTISMLMLGYVRACGCLLSHCTPFVCSPWVTIWLILYVLILAHCHVPCYDRQLVTACMCFRLPYVLCAYGEWAPSCCISYVHIFTQREVPCYLSGWWVLGYYVSHSFDASYVFSLLNNIIRVVNERRWVGYFGLLCSLYIYVM